MPERVPSGAIVSQAGPLIFEKVRVSPRSGSEAKEVMFPV